MLDERDLEIVTALQEDARATYADIAARVGLSASSVHERVRKLEASGVITAYRAVVDPEAIGLFVTALIAVTPLDPQQPDDLPERLARLPRGRGLPERRGRGQLRPEGAHPQHEPPRGADPASPREGRGEHPHDDRAVDPLRGSPREPVTGHRSGCHILARCASTTR